MLGLLYFIPLVDSFRRCIWHCEHVSYHPGWLIQRQTEHWTELAATVATVWATPGNWGLFHLSSMCRDGHRAGEALSFFPFHVSSSFVLLLFEISDVIKKLSMKKLVWLANRATMQRAIPFLIYSGINWGQLQWSQHRSGKDQIWQVSMQRQAGKNFLLVLGSLTEADLGEAKQVFPSISPQIKTRIRSQAGLGNSSANFIERRKSYRIADDF